MSNENYAGFWIRFVAYLIDLILLGVVLTVIVTPIIGALGFSTASAIENGNMSDEGVTSLMTMFAGAGMAVQVINFVIGLLYFGLMESSAKQATVGKMALGLKVIDKNGGRLSFRTAALRYIGKLVSGAIFMIGFIMAAFTEKKQALHDMIASTYVVKG